MTVAEVLNVDSRDSNETGSVIIILGLCVEGEATEHQVGLRI
jgi:hypothetical protein